MSDFVMSLIYLTSSHVKYCVIQFFLHLETTLIISVYLIIIINGGECPFLL